MPRKRKKLILSEDDLKALRKLANLRVKSKEDLISIISRWIDAVNADPVVYRWKWKLEDIMKAFN